MNIGSVFLSFCLRKKVRLSLSGQGLDDNGKFSFIHPHPVEERYRLLDERGSSHSYSLLPAGIRSRELGIRYAKRKQGQRWLGC